MKKNILILGSTGMLGMEVLRSFQSINNVNIYASYRKKQYLKNLNKKKLLKPFQLYFKIFICFVVQKRIIYLLNQKKTKV